MKKTEYAKYVEKTMPRTNEWKTLSVAFIVGGIICMIGEGVGDVLKMALPSLNKEEIGNFTTIIMIFLGSFLTAIGVYEKIGYYAGAGSIIPITGFANSVVSPAIEYNKEGIIYGVMAKMFTVAGPVIVSGISAAVVVGIIYYILGLMGISI